VDLVVLVSSEAVGVLVIIALGWRIRMIEKMLADMNGTIRNMVEEAITDEMKRMDDRIRTWVRRLSEPETGVVGQVPDAVSQIFAGQPMNRKE